MTRLRFVTALLLLAMLWSVSSAQAYPEAGISQSFRDFGLNLSKAPSYDPDADVSRSVYWAPLNVKKLRVIVPWDIGVRSAADGRRQEFENWLTRVTQLGAEPFVVFGPTERNPTSDEEPVNGISFTNVSTRCCSNSLMAPPVETYRAAIHDFITLWGPGTPANVRTIGAWNEPNVPNVSMALPGGVSSTVYTAGGGTEMYRNDCPLGASTDSNCGPLLAARYWNNVRAECPSCTVVAGEFDSDGFNNGPGYWETYAEKIEKVTSARPPVISFHGHHDVQALGAHGPNDCTTTNRSKCITSSFSAWLNGRGSPWNNRSTMKIWDTEVGAQHEAGTSGSTDDVAQRNRFNFLVDLESEKGVSRFYYYNFQQQSGSNDRGLIDTHKGNEGEGVNTTERAIWNAIRCRPSSECPWTPPSPAITTDVATGVTATTATVGGTVDPMGFTTAVMIDYGTTTAYGSRTSPIAVIPDARTTAQPVATTLTDLEPGTTYHYRIVTANFTVGPAYGPDRTFTTAIQHRGRTAFADVTGDGKADGISVPDAGPITVRVSRGDSFGAPGNWTAEPFWGNRGTFFADVTGDGKADAIASTGAWGLLVRRSTGSGFGGTENWGSNFWGAKYTFFADVTGDGKADAIAVDDDKVYVRASTGSAFGAAVAWTNEAFWADYIADVDGDGRADLIADSDTYGVLVRRSTGSGFGGTELWSNTVFKGDKHTFFADVTGDGKADAIAVKSEKVVVRPSTGSAFGIQTSWTKEAFWADYIADVDGDGRADLIADSDTYGVLVRRSTGSGFGGTELWSNTVFKGDKHTFFADVTGDGKADAIAVKSEKVVARPSTGSAFGTQTSWTLDPYWAHYMGDVTGDGKADLIALSEDWGTLVRRSTGSAFAGTETWAQVAPWGPPDD